MKSSQIPNILTILDTVAIQEIHKHKLSREDVTFCASIYQDRFYVDLQSPYTKRLIISLDYIDMNRLAIIGYRHQIKKFVKTIREIKEGGVNIHKINNPINNAVGWKI